MNATLGMERLEIQQHNTESFPCKLREEGMGFGVQGKLMWPLELWELMGNIGAWKSSSSPQPLALDPWDRRDRELLDRIQRRAVRMRKGWSISVPRTG